MYTWHVTFGDQARLHEVASSYQRTLARLPGLDVIPMPWLHLTMQGIAFTDEVSLDDISGIIQEARERLASRQPVSLTIGPALVDPEAILLRVAPPSSLTPVRADLRAAIADVRGAAAVPEADDWEPHISIAYSNGNGPAAPFAEALATVTNVYADITISAVSLIELSRDAHLYQWSTKAELSLSG
jgi:2'-5' RNA ligase